MYETARLQGRSAPNAAEFNTYAFTMLLVGRQKDAATHFFQVGNAKQSWLDGLCIEVSDDMKPI